MTTMHELILVETPVHGRTLSRRGVSGNLLVGFHGYGETAEAHLAELERIPGTAAWSLAAVQALHPFYTRSQEVVASWMTRMDRQAAIADNVEYVRRVVRRLQPERKLVFAGFSQGAAMAWRAAAAIPCDGVIVLGGDLPPDVAADAALPAILIGRGERDDFYTAEKLKHDLSFLAPRDVRSLVFDGGHEWTDLFRQEAGEFLARVARA